MKDFMPSVVRFPIRVGKTATPEMLTDEVGRLIWHSYHSLFFIIVKRKEKLKKIKRNVEYNEENKELDIKAGECRRNLR